LPPLAGVAALHEIRLRGDDAMQLGELRIDRDVLSTIGAGKCGFIGCVDTVVAVLA
jgi:hypothetical protein